MSTLITDILRLRAIRQPFIDQAEQWRVEINSFLTQVPARVNEINFRITQISREEESFLNRARSRCGFIPTKVNDFYNFFSGFLRQWEWIMKEEHFQDPSHHFFCQVSDLSSKSSFSVVDTHQLKPAFDELCDEDKVLIFSGFFPEEPFSDAESAFQKIQGVELQSLKLYLEIAYLRSKVSRLSLQQRNNLNDFLVKQARNDGIQINGLERDWANDHLYDSPDRLFSSLSQIFLMKRNEAVFALWKELYHAGTGEFASKLLVQCPLLDHLRRGVKLEIDEHTKEELLARVRFLVRIAGLNPRLKQKYENWDSLFQDCTKGFDEKLMQIILSPVPLFGGETASKIISSLEMYIEVIDDLIRASGLLEKDAKYLLQIINRQYALHPNHLVVQNRENFIHLLEKAKTALRTHQLRQEEGMVRQKPEQYQSIFLIRENEKILGKFKPLPQSSLTKEIVGESFNCLLGTDFAPAARGVWLSIRNELLEICDLLKTDRFEAAKRKFELLDKEFRDQIYYQIYKLKKPAHPPSNYGELAWNGSVTYPVTNEERVMAIDAYLDLKLPLKSVHSKFARGAYVEGMNQFNWLNVDLKNLVFHQLLEVKGPEHLWNGTVGPTTHEEKKRAIERVLESDSFDQFTLNRDPKWFHLQGTLQTWSQDCQEGTKLLYENPRAGEMLRNLPVSMVQMYNILGLIKGSGDCHSGNTLFQFGQGGQIENLIDCDDEFIMPSVNHYNEIQIWTLGLPQGAKPLLRPILRMLASPEFLAKWLNFKIPQKKSGTDVKIEYYQERIQKINRLCSEALENPSIRLTCQDLYFELYGGREKFQRVKQQEGHRPEFILFQYFMKKDMIQYLNEDAMRGEIFMRNAQELYS